MKDIVTGEIREDDGRNADEAVRQANEQSYTFFIE